MVLQFELIAQLMFLPHWGCLGRCGTTPSGRNNLVSKLVWDYIVFPPHSPFVLSAFFPLSLFPVCHLVRCNELAILVLGIVLLAKMTLFLMGGCQTLPTYGEANDLLDGCAAMDIGVSRVSGVECRLHRAQCCPVRVRSTRDCDGI